MTSSVVPATIDALVAVWAAALTPDQVYDGEPVQDPSELAYVMVGVNEPDDYGDQDAVTGGQSWPHTGHYVREENFTVRCAAIGWNGDSDPKAAREAVRGLMDALTTALQTDPTLGGVVLYSRGITDYTWRTRKDNEGARCKLLFGVECRARIQ